MKLGGCRSRVWCMSMVSVCVRVAVRADAGGVGRAQRELDARRGARARRQRPAAQVHAQRICHPSTRGDRPLPTPPYTGFLSCFFFCSFLFLLLLLPNVVQVSLSLSIKTNLN